jgi:DNA-binding NarL/FixJ family response regulator
MSSEDRGDRVPVRVMVIDDEALTRESLATRLARLDGVEVVARAGDVDEARRFIEEYEPDAMFVDILMPGGSGLDH